jgi:ABC-type antimicrobial peptide transport system permease subunit
VDKNQPVSDIDTLQKWISDQEAPFRIFGETIGFCAALALFLAGIGIYGVMSYLVESRTREIGIRMACGAGARTILWLVLKGNLKLVISGICLGLMVSWQLARLLASLLYRVSTNDPVTYILAVVVLVGAILLASLVPLKRAIGVDPMIVLRYE